MDRSFIGFQDTDKWNQFFNKYLIPLRSVLIFILIVPINRFESKIYTLIQYICLFILIIDAVIKRNEIKKNSWIYFAITALFAAGMAISTAVNFGLKAYNFRYAVYNGLLLLTVMTNIYIIFQEKENKKFYKQGIIFLVIVLGINDLLAVILPNEFFGVYTTDEVMSIGTFLVGNKFQFAYDHLLLMVLFLLYSKKNPLKTLVCCLILAASVYLVECTTVIVGILFFLCIYYLPKKIRFVFGNPYSILIYLFFSAFFLIFFSNILSFEPVRFFIEDILHEDITLTGRLDVYNRVFDIIEGHWIFGYGYGTRIVETFISWIANVQNAVLDMIIRYGLFSVICLGAYLFILFKKCCSTKSFLSQNVWLIICILYTFITMGIVEVTFNNQFFFYIFILFALIYSRGSYEHVKQ